MTDRQTDRQTYVLDLLHRQDKSYGDQLAKSSNLVNINDWLLSTVTNRLIGQIEDVAVEKSSFSLLNGDLSLSITKVWARQELVYVGVRQL